MFHEIHLGVTGLRRSGKTVFLTALIYQLTEVGSDGLDAFENRGVQLFPGELLPPESNKSFPYAENLARLRQSTPDWPLPTDEETHSTIEFRYQAGQYNSIKGVFLKTFGRAKDSGVVRLHIHDYPGEFLLDVPMLRWSFREWSQRTLNTMKSRMLQRADEYLHTVNEICKIPNRAPGVETTINLAEPLRLLRQAYGRFLKAAQAAGLEALPPGMTYAAWENREVQDWNEEMLPFVPLPLEPALPTSTIWNEMEQAYQKYRTDRVEPFVRRLRRTTRQLVLVDILRILRNGLLCFNDTQRCLAEIMKAYTYVNTWRTLATGTWMPHGHSIGLPRLTELWVNRGIERLIFAATKADHALVSHRNHLAKLLQSLAKHAAGVAAIAPEVQRTADYEWFSALRSTQDTTVISLGRPAEALVGTRKGEECEDHWNPGIVEPEWPTAVNLADWSFGNEKFAFPEFQPPPIPLRDGQPWPHMQFGNVLWQLMGDCFHVA